MYKNKQPMISMKRQHTKASLPKGGGAIRGMDKSVTVQTITGTTIVPEQ